MIMVTPVTYSNKFFPSKHVYPFGKAIVFALGTARPDRDEGEAGYHQNLG